MFTIQEINDDNFQSSVLNSEKLTLVDFFAPWCGPCSKMADVIASVAQDYQNSINVFKINTDSNLNTATKYSVSSLPTVLFFKDGEPKERLVGLLPKSSLINNIEKYL